MKKNIKCCVICFTLISVISIASLTTYSCYANNGIHQITQNENNGNNGNNGVFKPLDNSDNGNFVDGNVGENNEIPPSINNGDKLDSNNGNQNTNMPTIDGNIPGNSGDGSSGSVDGNSSSGGESGSVGNNIDYENGGTISAESTYNNLKIGNRSIFIDSILKKLNLNNQTILTSLDNNIIKNALHSNNDFRNINIHIENGSNTLDGKLVLRLIGTYKGKEINHISTISGFVSKNFFQDILIKNYKLNLYNWFNDWLPAINDLTQSHTEKVDLSEIEKINQNDFVTKYIVDADISVGNNFVATIKLSDAIKLGLDVQLGAKLENNNKNQFKLSIKNILFNPYKFENNSWKQTGNLENISYVVQNSLNYVSIPKKSEALQIVFDNTKINDEILSKHYPSYFAAQALYAKKMGYQGIPYPRINGLIQPPMEFLKRISHKYFGFASGDYLAININRDTIYADDFNNTLSFNLDIYDHDNDYTNPIRSSKQIVKNGITKDFAKFINTKIINNVFIRLEKLNQNNSLANTLVKNIKSKNQNTIENVFNGSINNKQTIQLNLSSFDKLNKLIVYSNNAENNFNENNDLLKEIEPRIFDIPIKYVDVGGAGGVFINKLGNKGDIEKSSGLFIYNLENLFQIKDISFQIPTSGMTNVELVKMDNNNVRISFDFTTLITINSMMIEQSSKMNLEISKDQFQQIK